MKEFWALILRNSALLYVPAVGFVLTVVLLHVKKRYVNDGVLFKRLPVLPGNRHASTKIEGNEMAAENNIDLEIALRKIHEPALADGDLGYAYWYQVGQLLQRAAGMQAEIDSLSLELEQCRAARRKRP
ncbi:hypothetical protein PQR70_26125 [Paraburkholderia madseniana]|uniref:hypothetical protein n=1 Tax=Paraburkholderia madseniana TaxID=2599607 RepID=UPI0038B7B1DE